MKKKATIQDIADALGISRNTVSKAINNSEGIADATRERILKKAVEMGYKHFSYVSTLADIGASKIESSLNAVKFKGEIALLTPSFLGQSHFACLMLDKFQREISQLGYTLNTHRLDKENRDKLTLPLTLSKDRVSGIICVEVFDCAYAQMLCELEIPILFVDGPAILSGKPINADLLLMDNTTEIMRLVDMLLQKDKRKIGFIGDWGHCQSFFERYMAFRGAMLLAGEQVSEEYCILTNDHEEMAESFKKLSSMPDVFMCANDFVAIDAIQELNKLGISVPGDVMFCGFDDSPESRRLSPSLTTIHIHTQVMAFSAIHLLMSRINAPSLDFRTLHTQTDLICRDSTGILSEE